MRGRKSYCRLYRTFSFFFFFMFVVRWSFKSIETEHRKREGKKNKKTKFACRADACGRVLNNSRTSR